MMASLKGQVLLLVSALSLLACAHNSVTTVDSEVAVAQLPVIEKMSVLEESMIQPELTVDDKQKPPLVVCDRTIRDLSISWNDRHYWCGKGESKDFFEESPPTSIGTYTIRNLYLNKPVIISATQSSSAKHQDNDATNHNTVPYHYSVVYVLPDSQSWFALWQKLESLSVTDKWKGINRQQGTYFIYTGVYMQLKHAQVRQSDLAAKTEITPLIRKRSGS